MKPNRTGKSRAELSCGQKAAATRRGERAWHERYTAGEAAGWQRARMGASAENLTSGTQQRGEHLTRPNQRREAVRAKKRRGSPCCGRRIIHIGNTLHARGLQTMHYECGAC